MFFTIMARAEIGFHAMPEPAGITAIWIFFY
jgi:hypothetical protein